MTLQVGRVTGLRPDPNWSRSGDTLTFSGTFKTDQYRDPAEIDVRRMQVQNLADNPDEEFYPVLYAGDPSLNGHYRVLSSSVSALGPIRNGSGRWSITLQRHPDGRNARQEVATMYAVRQNFWIPAVTTSTAILTATALDSSRDLSGSSGVTPNLYEWLTPDGAILVPWRGSVNSARREAVSFTTGPDTHYVGACLLEEKVGDKWYPVINRIPSRDLTLWRISNGLIRVGPSSTAPGRLVCEGWNGSTWDQAVVSATDGTNPAAGGWVGTFDENDAVVNAEMTIARNDLDAIALHYDGPDSFRRTVSIRRGALCVELIHKGQLAPAWDPEGLQFVPTTTTVDLSNPDAGIEQAAGTGGRFSLMGIRLMANSNASGLTVGTLGGSNDGKVYAIGYRRLVGGGDLPTQADVIASMLCPVWSKTRMVVR
jgi:hypothetical protein